MPHILHIDDDRMVRMAVHRVLDDLDVELREAISPVEAIQMINAGFKPDLIICDMEMPRMSGEEFLAVRSMTPELAAIPVVMLSGHPDLPEIAERFGVPYVVKAKPRELLAVVRELLGC